MALNFRDLTEAEFAALTEEQFAELEESPVEIAEWSFLTSEPGWTLLHNEAWALTDSKAHWTLTEA